MHYQLYEVILRSWTVWRETGSWSETGRGVIIEEGGGSNKADEARDLVEAYRGG